MKYASGQSQGEALAVPLFLFGTSRMPQITIYTLLLPARQAMFWSVHLLVPMFGNSASLHQTWQVNASRAWNQSTLSMEMECFYLQAKEMAASGTRKPRLIRCDRPAQYVRSGSPNLIVWATLAAAASMRNGVAKTGTESVRQIDRCRLALVAGNRWWPFCASNPSGVPSLSGVVAVILA